MRYRSPTHTSSSARPSTVRFSPKSPAVRSERPSCSRQYRYESSWYTRTARCTPPWPSRSPWPSPSMFSRRTMRRPSTGDFQIPVWTVTSCHGTSIGSPTLTETNVATAAVIGPRYARAAIWSLCVSKGDLVTHILDIENLGDQIGSPMTRVAIGCVAALALSRRGQTRSGCTNSRRRRPSMPGDYEQREHHDEQLRDERPDGDRLAPVADVTACAGKSRRASQREADERRRGGRAAEDPAADVALGHQHDGHDRRHDQGDVAETQVGGLVDLVGRARTCGWR